MTEASGNATHPEQRANHAPGTTKPAVGVAHPQPLPNAYPAFRVPAQEGYATSYDAVAALEIFETFETFNYLLADLHVYTKTRKCRKLI